MQFKTFSVRLSMPTAVLLFSLLLPSAANTTSRYQILHSFSAGLDGGGLWSGVVFDKKGNLYGTTSGGGTYGSGVVYKLKPQPVAEWLEKVLYNFQIDDRGYDANGTLITDAVGNLYGTTDLGGAHNHGTAFQMTPNPSGWIFNVLYSFCSQPNCSDGGSMIGGLTLDAEGNLYGASNVVFELSASPSGWTESVLYTFCSKPGCADGGGVAASLILDAKNNLYGTTGGGGAYKFGTVFKLRHMPDGSWTERVLHSFGGFPTDGHNPEFGQLAFDAAGSLYGTTVQGGRNSCGLVGCGTVFKLTRQPNGHWKETILHHFKPGKSGNAPFAGVVIDSAGNLYGTTEGGGDTNCECGVVYKLAPNPDGSWTHSVLHRFHGYDGYEPGSELVFDDQSNLYGNTIIGGPKGGGVVFKLTP